MEDSSRNTDIDRLLREVRACTLCEEFLEDGVRPVLQLAPEARILIAGQAPGRRVHESGVPFDDPSGERLRDWMGVTPAEFYDARKVAILPLGFCFPGSGRSGDLPPRLECARAWREALLEQLPALELTLVIGQYAIGWHGDGRKRSLTEVVRGWKAWGPSRVPMPHPSPRNNLWLRKNPWFEQEVLPHVRSRVGELL